MKRAREGTCEIQSNTTGLVAGDKGPGAGARSRPSQLIPGFDSVALGKELDLDTLGILQRLELMADAQGMVIDVTLRHFKGVLPMRIIARPRCWYAERVKGSDPFNIPLITDAQGIMIGVTLRHFEGVLPVRIITRPRLWYAERVNGSDPFNLSSLRYEACSVPPIERFALA